MGSNSMRRINSSKRGSPHSISNAVSISHTRDPEFEVPQQNRSATVVKQRAIIKLSIGNETSSVRTPHAEWVRDPLNTVTFEIRRSKWSYIRGGPESNYSLQKRIYGVSRGFHHHQHPCNVAARKGGKGHKRLLDGSY